MILQIAMKIARIETFHVPPRWLFVRLETEDGHVGWGEASLEAAVAKLVESKRIHQWPHLQNRFYR